MLQHGIHLPPFGILAVMQMCSPSSASAIGKAYQFPCIDPRPNYFQIVLDRLQVYEYALGSVVAIDPNEVPVEGCRFITFFVFIHKTSYPTILRRVHRCAIGNRDIYAPIGTAS